MRLILILSIIVLLQSCKKEPVLDSAPSLVGSWIHYSDNDAWHIIHIESNGEGTMEWYRNDKIFKDTKTRPWYVKDNTLYFGKATFNGELYDIIEYPILNSIESIQNLDTLKSGKEYMILDDLYYIEY